MYLGLRYGVQPEEIPCSIENVFFRKCCVGSIQAVQKNSRKIDDFPTYLVTCPNFVHLTLTKFPIQFNNNNKSSLTSFLQLRSLKSVL